MMKMFGRPNYPKCDAVYWDKPIREFVLEMQRDVPPLKRQHRSVLPK